MKPIACSLSADELPRRLAEIGALGRDALLGKSPAGELRFRNDAETRARLEAIVAAESECCPFLDFELRAHGDELRLTVDAPEEARSIARDLRAAFEAGARTA
jgi:hypothetical protein